MTKLCLAVVCVTLVAVFAEPPPPSYLPPQSRSAPSSQYGAPSQQFGAQRSGGSNSQGSGRSYSYNSLAENQFGGSSRSSSRGGFSGSTRSKQYNAQPTRQFGAPSARQQPSQQYSAPSARQQPSQQYSAPSARQQPSQQYSAPSARQQPSQQYGAPSFDDSVEVNAARFSQGSRNGFGASRSFGAQPAPRQQSSYAAAARQQPSTQYGAPSSQYGAPSSQYGAPFGRSNMDDDLAEPANYEYNYEVNAAEEAGPEFGHQETREDDFAQGEYHVVLPDGRMQIVEYEADEEGFRPKIRYEETGYPDARDNQGPY